MARRRTPVQKTLLALEHHAKGCSQIAHRIAMHVAGNGWTAHSSKGGANSWYLVRPRDNREFHLRYRNGTILVQSHYSWMNGKTLAIFKTRLDVDRFFERNA